MKIKLSEDKLIVLSVKETLTRKIQKFLKQKMED